MFDLSLPWWEFILRGTIVYLVLLVMVRSPASEPSASSRHST
jgi:hypothetical protein